MSADEKILVIEDDDSLREDLVMVLSDEGYRVQSAASGLDALELANRQNFDLVVSDIRMAGMDGLDTLERLRQEQPSVATLIITGFTAEADSIRAVRLGVGDYLKKPFELSEFIAAVARQLHLHRSRKLRKKREESLRQTATWALERLAANPRSGRLAWATASEMGLSPEVAGQAQMAVLLELCQQAAPQWDPDGLPGDLLNIVEELRSAAEEVSLPARIAQVALQPNFRPEGESTLAAAWERANQRSQSQEENAQPQRRRRVSLLQLARSQEAVNPAEARTYFETIVGEGASDREQVEALLGLCRLSRPESDRCLAYAQQAVTLARSLNGLLGCVSALQAGLWLVQAGLKKEAVSFYEQAGRVGRELGQPLLEAKAILALSAAGSDMDAQHIQRALGVLLEVSERFELLDEAWWIAPSLLRLQARAPHPLQEKALAVIGRDAPGIFLRLVQAGQLDPAARLPIVAALKEPKHPVALECMKLLAADAQAEVRAAAEAVVRSAGGVLLPPTVRIYTLGSFEVFRGDERIPDQQFRSSKQRFLLSRLAASRRPLPTERIVDDFWPDSGEGGRSSLNVCVFHLRKVLRPKDWPEELDYIQRDNMGLQLNPQLPVWHDVNEVLALAAPEANPGEETVGRWKKAVDLYRGPYLETCYMDWAVTTRESLEVTILTCLRSLLEILVSQQRAAETLEYANRLLELDKYCQEGHLAAMKAHLWQGRPEASIKQFEQCKKLLARELQIEPSIALLEAHQRTLLSVK
ncbi:MAG: response regulator [Candidatus Eremiobacteraeota bacterium]|nr:response regulator [Candidatus Eremiobacteraeota bacterium]MCW5869527.1 response regulator [Candidatus Eremiobacteraeota bacterium]